MALVVGELVAKLSLDDSEFSKGLKNAGQSLEKIGKNVSDVGEEFTKKVTTPIVGMGTAALLTAANFEKAMSNVQALSGATGDELARMAELAKKLGAETQFSAQDAADAMGFLAMAGFKTAEIMDALPGVLNLAAAGQLDLARAADIASNILTGYGLKVDELARVNDVLAKAATSSNVNVEMLGESFKYAGPMAAAAGLQFEEAAAMMALLGNAGIQGSQAGTTLRGALGRLLNPVGQAADVIEALGLQITDSSGKMLPMIDILRQLEEKGATTADIMALFGLEAGPGMQAILAQGVDALAEMTAALENAGGTAEHIAKVQMDNLMGSWDELTSALEGLAISMGELLIPVIRDLIVAITEWISWLDSLDPSMKQTILQVGAIVAAIGPLLLIMGKLTTAFGVVAGAIAGLSAPVVATIAILGALGAALMTLWNTNETFREQVLAVWEHIKASAAEIWPVIQETVETVWYAIKETITAVVDFLNAFWNAWGDEIIAIFTWLWDTVKAVFITTWETLKGVIDGALQVIRGIFEFFAAAFRGDWEAAWGAVKEIFNGFVQILVSLWTGFWEQFVNIITAAWEGIKGAILHLWEYIKREFTEWVDRMKNLGVQIMQGLLDGLVSMFDRIRQRVSDFVSGITSKVKSVLGIASPSKVFAEIGQNIGEGLAKGIEGTARLVDRATDALIPEVSLPAAAPAVAAVAGGGGGYNITLNVYGSVGVDDIAERLVQAIRRKQGLRI